MVDGCKLVALVPVEWGPLDQMRTALFNLSRCTIWFSGQDFAVAEGETMPCILAMFTYCCGFVKVLLFFEPFFQCLFCFDNVFMLGILVTATASSRDHGV